MSDDRQAGIKGLNFYALLIGLLVVTQEGDRVLGCSAGFAGFYALLIGLLVATTKSIVSTGAGIVSMPC